jgi:glycosyltransferase involved in cell wall biosynthesis
MARITKKNKIKSSKLGEKDSQPTSLGDKKTTKPLRIVIDMQGAQAENRFRGIGRYTMNLTKAMVRNRGEHEIILAVSGQFSETIEPIRAAFDGLLSQEAICVWHTPEPVAFLDYANDWRRQSGELVREAFLASLRPDIVHVTSFFEGLVDNAVISIGQLPVNFPVAVTLFDLIPFIQRKPYLENPAVESWYLKKIESLRKSDLLLAISDSTRQEGIIHLGMSDECVINMSSDVDVGFQKLEISASAESALRKKYGLHRPFVMYTGGIDHRKNIEGLIRAYAKLPQRLRNAHYLAIVCTVRPGDRQRLERLAKAEGMTDDELVLTGFVPEVDLISLYNLCKLFVFPSWHEGFGLPALEAMRCGAPVIAANTTSMPEVIGLEEALFDPHSFQAIAVAMKRGLTDSAFRRRLIEHGKIQSTKFSWDKTARQAIMAMERVVDERRHNPSSRCKEKHWPKMAYLSPLPPKHTGIADYSTVLLPELARHYDIEVIVDQGEVADPWLQASCQVRSVAWFVENASSYDRVLYHFGNSTFHQHMFGLLKRIPGVVVLHDFYLSGVLNHMEVFGYEPGALARELLNSHGYSGIYDRRSSPDMTKIVWKYPCSLGVIQDSLGIVSHSENTVRLAREWYGLEGRKLHIIPLMRDPKQKWERLHARKMIGLKDDDFVVCSFGMMGVTKLNHRLLQAWDDSQMSKSNQCHLVFVGENHQDDYGLKLSTIIRNSRNIRITGWADEDLYYQYLAAADVGVQLRTLSRGETSAAVLDCMNYGLATIVNANGSMADLDGQAVWMLPEEFEDEALVNALETLWNDKSRRHRLAVKARQVICEIHNPTRCAEKYRVAIEQCYASDRNPIPTLTDTIARIPGHAPQQPELMAVASAISLSFPQEQGKKQLLIDISELVQRDAKSGIQRVVRSILSEWLTNSPGGYRVEPIYATVTHGYRYARRFTAGFIGCTLDSLIDEPINYAPGDVFYALDLQPQVQVEQREFYRQLRNHGVYTIFTVYDLLCVQQQQYFLPGAKEGFTHWLEVVTENDGAVCISESVASDLSTWISEHALKRVRPFVIKWFHLGADVDSSSPTKGVPFNAKIQLATLGARTSFLMVGTLEPRKGYEQVLGAFEGLWRQGSEINLVIVGKQGWMVDELVSRLRIHPEIEKRLFWLEGISDEYLEKIYGASSCLIAASYGEGFGLPLIEAARHKIPIIARDIPVFREVAGANACYFNATTSLELEKLLKVWLDLYRQSDHPQSKYISSLKWSDSARELSKAIAVVLQESRYS